MTAEPQLRAIQAERAQAYAALDGAFRAYLSNSAEGPWKHAMRSATQCFQDLSNRTRCLPAPGGAAPEWEPAIERLQRLEQRKLQLTMTQYTLRLSAARGAFSWQKSDGQAAESHQHGPGCGHGHGAPPVPTEEELAGALQETIQGLEVRVCLRRCRVAVPDLRVRTLGCVRAPCSARVIPSHNSACVIIQWSQEACPLPFAQETVAEINEQADELYEIVRNERDQDLGTAPDAAPCS